MAFVVVSDVHLGTKESESQKFYKFLSNFDEDHLIIAGDLFDFWRRDNASVILKNEDIIELLGGLKKVTYIAGNHDYSMLCLTERYPSYYLKAVKNTRLFDGKRWYYIDHGYDIDVFGNMEPMTIEEYEAFSSGMCNAGNTLGSIASAVWAIRDKINWLLHQKNKYYDNIIINELARSRSSFILNGKHPDDFYIFGHTHEAFNYLTAANTGCWLKGTPCNYIIAEHGIVKLEEYIEKE